MRGVNFFTVKVPIYQCYLEWSVFSKYMYMYVYFQELFDLSRKQTSKFDILFRDIRSSGEGKITHVCVCVCSGGGGGGQFFYFLSPKPPQKRGLKPPFPQIKKSSPELLGQFYNIYIYNHNFAQVYSLIWIGFLGERCGPWASCYNWKINNKACQIMWKLNTSTCIHDTLVVCVIYSLFYMYIVHRDSTGIRENLNGMKHSFELCLFRGREKH